MCFYAVNITRDIIRISGNIESTKKAEHILVKPGPGLFLLSLEFTSKIKPANYITN